MTKKFHVYAEDGFESAHRSHDAAVRAARRGASRRRGVEYQVVEVSRRGYTGGGEGSVVWSSRTARDNPRPSPNAARDIMRAWNREGASEAWHTAMLYAEGDQMRAGGLVATLDEEDHVRNGILSYGGLSLSDFRDNPQPWARVFG